MNQQGLLVKMKVSQDEYSAIHYQLRLLDGTLKESTLIAINDYLNKEIQIQFNGNIQCVNCAKKVKKTFMNGYCYTCFQSAPETSPCVLRPELCRGHLNEGRNLEWELNNHVQPHVVYLAASDVVKVGVTRKNQIPTRWIDQGANEVIVFAETPNRYLAGVIEVALKDLFTDKTNWRKMLSNQIDDNIDLEEIKYRTEELLPSDLQDFLSEDDNIYHFNYPSLYFPEKIKSISLDKMPNIHKKLIAIKGQYLIFEDESVLNIRNHTGYDITFSAI
ncbi:MAG: DUF2797 domain-containing protein [Crocinitomicaceae bacterium]|nr:DUF2797 domain-containing protein [Crocinitomicaceae bacterium]